MAIQVGGTTVINDSRSLTNIASIDATTEAAISAAGFSQTTGDITGVTAGSGITGGGTSGTVTINHADTSSQGSINNSGNTVIQDISVDTYGHITSMSSATISTTPPTTYSAVGTYTVGWYLQDISAEPAYSGFSLSAGGTYAGSSLRVGASGSTNAFETASYGNPPTQALSGTWRVVSGGTYASKTASYTAFWYPLLFVRIS